MCHVISSTKLQYCRAKQEGGIFGDPCGQRPSGAMTSFHVSLFLRRNDSSGLMEVLFCLSFVVYILGGPKVWLVSSQARWKNVVVRDDAVILCCIRADLLLQSFPSTCIYRGRNCESRFMSDTLSMLGEQSYHC